MREFIIHYPLPIPMAATAVYDLYHLASQKPFNNALFIQSREAFDNINESEYKKLFAMCTEHKSPTTLLLLGRLHAFDKCGLRDDTKAFDYFTQAVNLGNQPAMYSLAMWYKNNNNFPKAIELLIPCAELGNTYAIMQLGVCYTLIKDYTSAFKWFNIGAEQKIPESIFQLGTCYYNGYGVLKDINKAFTLFTKAADLGFPSAIHNVATFYQDGIIVPKDEAKAVEFLQKSASLGFITSKYSLGCILKDEKLLTEVANIEDIDATLSYHLGTYYYTGHIVPKDLPKAAQLLQKAADLEHPQATCYLALCYENGHGVQQDLKKSFELHTKASILGNISSKNALGRCYLLGIAVTQDPKKAYELFQEAADHDSKEAIHNLALLYEHGCHVPQDIPKARELYTKAGDLGYAESYQSLAKLYGHDPITALKYYCRAHALATDEKLKAECTNDIKLITPPIDMFHKYFSMEEENKQLKTQNEEQTIELQFRPGGIGANKAMNRYTTKANSHNYVRQSLRSKAKPHTKIQRRHSIA
jgi:TPR repeat protein